jgi:YidC/Oxa1 family membrane protein insertase
MEKRAILAIGLSVLVFIGFQYYQQKQAGKRVAARPTAQVQSLAQDPEKKVQPVRAEAAQIQTSVSAEDTTAAARTVTVETSSYKAIIDNRGAVLTSWELKEYKSTQNRPFEMIAGSRQEEDLTFLGSMIFEDPSLTSLANNEFYQIFVEGRPETGAALVPPVTVILKLKRGDLNIEKRYSFEKDNYIVDFSMICDKSGKGMGGKFFLGQDIGPVSEHLNGSTKLQAVYYASGKVRREKPPKDESEVKKIEGDVRWAGLDMQYFAIISIPQNSYRYFDIQKRLVKAFGLDGKELNRDLLRVTTPVTGSMQCRLYLGPKKQANLEAVRSADITGVIDYGMFKILVYPLLTSLRWIYQYVHNYGYSIIILTFLLTILLFPFRLKQMISMKKMQVVQPKVKAIQEKYRRYKKTDPKRAEMNQEVMALYKEHNVNPLGGCLPLLLQMPLLFAFYALLNYSIELRQAPFIWWIHDLSIKDPFYVLPIVMGITSFISQKMTPMTPGADPAQAKIMMMMPIMFTVMFLSLSSGLNLYFLCSNIFQIAFQKITERWIGDGSSGEPARS